MNRFSRRDCLCHRVAAHRSIPRSAEVLSKKVLASCGAVVLAVGALAAGRVRQQDRIARLDARDGAADGDNCA